MNFKKLYCASKFQSYNLPSSHSFSKNLKIFKIAIDLLIIMHNFALFERNFLIKILQLCNIFIISKSKVWTIHNISTWKHPFVPEPPLSLSSRPFSSVITLSGTGWAYCMRSSIERLMVAWSSSIGKKTVIVITFF